MRPPFLPLTHEFFIHADKPPRKAVRCAAGAVSLAWQRKNNARSAEEACVFCTSIPTIRPALSIKIFYDRQATLGNELCVYVPVPQGFDPGARDFGAYSRIDPNHFRWDRLAFFTSSSARYCAAP